MEALYKLADGQAEVMEFHVKQTSRVTGRELQKMKLKKNILIGKIYRNGSSFTPSGFIVTPSGNLHFFHVTSFLPCNNGIL